MRKYGFTLIELLVSIGIIAVLATIVLVAVGPAGRNSRDNVRRTQLDLIRRFLANGTCFTPHNGPGDYDLDTIAKELIQDNPEAAKLITSVPRDPRSGSTTESGFRYLYGADGHCAIYANLERANTKVTLPNLDAPTAGGGTGTLESNTIGSNGTNRYYQISK